uniref:Retinal dehydrogenase 2 n=1 Tax=Phallusia mammillata TaxID=59560 RepID=A0A6F9D6Q7_9ASCI|nr:retinal dehydrogenase 2 [Phallusia mammillata]
MFINNEWYDASGGATFNDINPSTEKVTARIAEASEADVDKAVAAATAAFQPGSPWRKMDASDRGVLINKLADLIDENKYYLACLETLDSGKPYTHTFFMDTTGISKLLRYYAGWTDKMHGKTVPVDGDYLSYTLVQPMGVCGLILPWNMPLITMGMKLGPALACGNTVVIKPDENTPLTALFLASLTKEAGFPAGVFNVVPGGPTAGAALVNHHGVQKISFTGSIEIGRKIEEASSKTNMKRLTLELSGNCPNIIFADADLDYAVEQAHQAVFMNQGQMCTAGARTFVHEDIYDEFVKKSVARASKKMVADPFQLYSEQGPQISRKHFDSIMGYIKAGKEEGAKLECGGSRHGDKGLYIQPTVFSGVTDEMKIAKEEIFGPVQCILKFSTIEEVVERANNTQYGLAAGIFTQNVSVALEISKALESGTVWVNCYNAFAVQSPFGGLKMSGKGKEMGEESLREFSEIKTVTLKLPQIQNISFKSNAVRQYSGST